LAQSNFGPYGSDNKIYNSVARLGILSSTEFFLFIHLSGPVALKPAVTTIITSGLSSRRRVRQTSFYDFIEDFISDLQEMDAGEEPVELSDEGGSK